ncbi:unnamed protein product [Penicillium salamii]|uniref:Uncharacterized protein n=1 Tax=Penicillium salamii TaxID=1612424 RepID=A0A9W4IWE3_9EURO|nr:unnamed protein product [Penicillium salamii]CAG8309453.1 unnamed protein product [Penicillium salamii]CAG8336513.1 unnamed protein product [Penicillium salamii]CAG8363302.1 unnamed protein product [Penicillium salamii]CAG8372906.1 unnamed protein product [Penicillium salamii]
MQMESWRRRGYVPDSDSDEEDGLDSLETKNRSSSKPSDLGNLEYIDLPAQEGSSSQPKELEQRIEEGSVTLSDTENRTRIPSKTNFEIQIPTKSADKGSAQKRQSLGEFASEGIRSTNTVSDETTPTQRRGHRTYGARSSAAKTRKRQSTQLDNTNINTPERGGSIYDIPASSQEQDKPRVKASSKESTPRASIAQRQAKAQSKPVSPEPKTKQHDESSSTRSSSPDELTLISQPTRKKSPAKNRSQHTEDSTLPPPLPPQVNSDDDSPLSSVPSSIGSPPLNDEHTNKPAENTPRDPEALEDGHIGVRGAILSQLDANPNDELSQMDIPEELLQELPQGTQRRFRKRTTIQLQPYALDLVQWQENQRRMGLPIHRRVRHIADESQEQDSYDPAAPSSSPPAEEYLPPIRHDRPRQESGHDSHEQASWHARMTKRQKTSHATPKHNPQLHKRIKPRGIRDDPLAIDDQNVDSIFDLTSSPPHTGRPSSASRTPRALEEGFRFPRGWSPPAGVSVPKNTDAGDDLEPGGMADNDDDGGIQSIPSDSQQSDEGQSDENDSDAETRAIQRAQRQIRGVLPASHMRIEQKKAVDQQKLAQREKERQAALHRPDGKGVARKLVRRGDRSMQPATQQSRGLFDLGDSDDDSDDGISTPKDTPITNTRNPTRVGPQDSFTTDGDIVEDNRIDYMFAPVVRKPTGPRKAKSLKRPKSKTSAFTGEREPKRPRQTRMTDASYGGRRTKKSSTVQRPRIGILDAPDVATKSRREQPHFLRVAARQARSRRDAGRRSPTQKFLKLASRDDTLDANDSLRDWKRGSIPQRKIGPPRPRIRSQSAKASSGSRAQAPRPPRAPRTTRLGPNARTMHVSSQTFQGPVDAFMSQRPPVDLKNAPHDTSAAPAPGAASTPALTHSNPNRNRNTNPTIEAPSRQPEKRGHLWIMPNNRGIAPLARSGPRPAGTSAARPSGGPRLSRAVLSNSLSSMNRLGGPQHASQNYKPSFTLDRYLSDTRSTGPEILAPSPHSPATNPGQQTSQTTSRKPPQPRRRIKKHTPTRINLETDQYQQIIEPTAIISDDSEAPTITHVENRRPAAFTANGLSNFQRFYPVEFGVTSLRENTFFHESTFIGSGEFSRSLHLEKRNLDGQASPISIRVQDETFSWGSWSDTVSSQMGQVFDAIIEHVERGATTSPEAGTGPDLDNASRLYRLLIKYVSESLVFMDPVDRTAFITRATGLVSQARDPLAAFLSSEEYNTNGLVKIASFNMVISNQIHQVSSHRLISSMLAAEALDLVKASAKDVAGLLVTKSGSSEFKALSKENNETERRDLGIRDDYPSVEAYVVMKHILRTSDHYHGCFEEIQLEACDSALIRNERDVGSLESGWRGLFAALPLNELDPLGISRPGNRFTATNDNWKLAKRLLAPALDHFEASSVAQPISYNNYCRVLFHRCHRLINHWGWRECKPALDTLFDFFAKNTLHNLKLEEANGSPSFLDELDSNPSLEARTGEPCFHTFLKIVASGLRFLTKRYDKKKIRNFAWRLLPNHGRVYPKEQPLHREDLDALRNHHDLLSTLYWAVPDGCRPRLETIRNLVHPATSHREACSISLRSWSRLVRFKLSTDEELSGLDPFGDWYGYFVSELQQQHSYARKEIESQNTGDNRVSQQLVERTISQNQRQIEELLSVALSGLRTAVQLAPTLAHAHKLLVKTPFETIIALFNPKLPRVNSVVAEALQVVVAYTRKDTAASSIEAPVAVPVDEDSQEFGDWDAIEAVYDQQTPPSEGIEFAANVFHPIISRLVSNCFGEDHCPEDAILLNVLECWTSLACVLVRHGLRTWDSYLSEYGNDSWTQLRKTAQTRKFAPLFLAACIEKDARIISDCRVEAMSLWMSSLVERASMLKFQHRLAEAFLNQVPEDVLLGNLPFYKDKKIDRYAITLEDINSRRLSLLSSLLSNMRENLQEMELSGSPDFSTTKQEYSEVVQRVMNAMKDNYQELGNGTTQAAQGAYVDFVHSVIGFLQQHTSDMRPIDPFFTNPASFPLPSQDPRYIVAKLKRYEPKLYSSKEVMTLVGFIQSISERATIDSQQSYLIDQLYTSMKNTYESGTPAKPTLRAVLLQCVFPAYLESTFENPAAWIPSHPIIQTITLGFKKLLCNLDTFDSACVSSVIDMIDVVCRASCQALNTISSHRDRLKAPATVFMISAFVDMICSVLPIIDYIERATETGGDLFRHVKWINDFIKSVTECLELANPDIDCTADISYVAFPGQPSPSNGRKTELFGTAHRLASADLQPYLSRLSSHQGKYYFTRPGHESQEVTIEAQIATAMTQYSEAQQAFEDAARGFARRAVSLELV